MLDGYVRTTVELTQNCAYKQYNEEANDTNDLPQAGEPSQRANIGIVVKVGSCPANHHHPTVVVGAA